MKKVLITMIIMILLFGGCLGALYYVLYRPKVEQVASCRSSQENMVEESSNKDIEISKLRNSLNNREISIKGLTHKIEDIEAENDRLRESVGKMEEQKDELMSYKNKSEEEKENLKKDKEDLEKAKDKLFSSMKETELQKRVLKEELLKMQQEIKRMRSFNNELIELFDDEIKTGDITVTRIGNRLILEIASNRLFSVGSKEISLEGEKVIKKVSGVLKNIEGNLIQIAGYTDNTPVSSTGDYNNWDLASARALKVLKILEKEGLDPEIMYAASFGEYHPRDTNETEEGRSANRRIDIQILPIPSTLEEALLFESQTGISSSPDND